MVNKVTSTSTNTRYIPDPVKNLLWSTSAGKCAYKTCREDLVVPGNDKDGPATIGQIAHIFAHSEKGPRPNPDGFTEATNSYDNLLLLCANHHKEVDVQTNTHTVTELKQWKKNHEQWVARRLAEQEITNIDLASIINWISENSNAPSTDYRILPPDQKMTHNGMSPITQRTIATGLMHSGEVGNYVNHRAKMEQDFPERLLKPLLDLYNLLKARGFDSDVIFSELRFFACGNSFDFNKQLAAVAIVSYFFERCEIFEK